MKKNIEKELSQLFVKWAGEEVQGVFALPLSGSYREYYRISGKTKKAMGVYNADKKENAAFLSFTQHFISKGINVPQVYAEKAESDIYLLEDLGDVTLFSYLAGVKKNVGGFPNELLDMYKKVIRQLPKLQVIAGKDLDYSKCYPRASFDKQSMLWDLSYFKYYFLKLARIHFDEQVLEDDFQAFSDYLLQADCDFFLYRDFQSRNIMISNDQPYFIDYQGGRRGALQYDLASLLYDAKADIPQPVREELLEYYLEILPEYKQVNKSDFKDYFYGYVIIRILQALGAYGFRGYYEKKTHFLQSIPYALKNLDWILKNVELPVKIPALLSVLDTIIHTETLYDLPLEEKQKLSIKVNSFSYKRGIPVDESGHGGGFVFDCRAIHNPGKYEEYKVVTGRDQSVIEFFGKETEMEDFLKNVYALVDQSVDKYLLRNFDSLMISFGCTGGQHRSVFCAEKLAEHLNQKYAKKLSVKVRHREQEMKGNF